MGVAVGPWIQFFEPFVHLAEPLLERVEKLLGALVAEGFTERDAGYALGMVGSLAMQSLADRARALRGVDSEHEYWAQIDATLYPRIASAPLQADLDDLERRFAYSLRCATAGIAALGGAPAADHRV